jgi:DNA-binding CsgD family transcriptional regulator
MRLVESSPVRSMDVAYLVLTNVRSNEWSALISAETQVIGRSKVADIRVPANYRSVSRRHAEIWMTSKGEIKLRDLGSQAGTRVNDVWIGDRVAATVAVGDRIWLGGLEFQVVEEISILTKLEAATDPASAESPSHSGTSILKFDRSAAIRDALRTLTRAELEVVLWMTRGYLHDDELARILHRSPHTVRTQVGSVLRKMSLSSRGEVLGILKRRD